MPDFRVELRDADGTLRERSEPETLDLSWTYNRVGGCGEFDLTLDRKFLDYRDISADWDVRLYLKRPNTDDTFDLWYRGYVEEVGMELKEPSAMRVRGRGYSGQLSRVLITASYAATEVASIVADIMLNQGVTSKTSITFSGENVSVTSVTAQSMGFQNVVASDALRSLAGLVGTREWGVDRNAGFFFHGRRNQDSASAVDLVNFAHTKAIKDLVIQDNFRELINSVYVEGRNASDNSTLVVESVNSSSQVQYGRREQRVTDGTIASSVDAAALGASVISDRAEPRQEISFNYNLDAEQTMVESSAITGAGGTRVAQLIRLPLETTYFNEENFGEGYFCGEQYFHLVDITYSINERQATARVRAGEFARAASNVAPLIEAVRTIDAIRQRDLSSVVSSLSAKVDALSAMTIRTFTSNGTWTKPTGLIRVRVTAVGGGGGGGGSEGSPANVRGGGGGSGGAAIRSMVASSLASTETITVGAGGSAGTGSGAGGTGGNSTFGSLLTGFGGSGGGRGSSDSGGGGEEGGAGQGDVNIDGQSGEVGGTVGYGSGGTMGVFGGGGSPPGLSSGIQGAPFGGGGSGGRENGFAQPGGAGGAGVVVVEEYA